MAPVAWCLILVAATLTCAGARLPLPATIAAAGNDSLAAAQVLADSLSLVTMPVRVVSPAQAQSMNHVAVGFEAALAVGLPEARMATLGDDGFVVTTAHPVAAGSVAIGASSGSLRGAVNGAYSLLRQLGFHTLAPNASVRPAAVPMIPNGGFDILVRPPFEEREVMANGVANCCCTCAATNVSGALGFNGIHAHGPEGIHPPTEWRNQYAVGVQVAQSTANVFDLLAPIGQSWAHGVPLLCRRPKNVSGPPTYLCPSVFDAHPDWFVCRNTSNRTAAEPLGATVYPCTKELVNLPWAAQPCWSHPTLINQLTRAVLGILNASRQVHRPVATVSQMDGNALACPLDYQLNAIENSSGGAQFHAINAIANAVAAEYPNATVSTLAYHGSREPPKKLQLRSNVMIRVCLDTVDQSAPLSHPRNAEWARRLKAWRAVVPRIW